MDRRTFTLQSELALLSGVTITITGCGSTTPTSPTTGGGGSSTPDVTATISANHGHVATITGAQITADQALALDIRGQATHTHTVNLTAADLTAIANRQVVAKESTTDQAHNHTVTFQMM
jgi:hypothetical protein